MEVGFATAEIVGVGITNTLIVLVLVHEPLAPVTVNTVVAVGVTTTVPPLNDPGFHVYDVAPLEDNVAVDPAQTAGGLEVAVSVGVEVTVRTTVTEFVQLPLLPVTVYVVVVAGETETDDPLKEPGIHVYVVAPEAVNVDELPEQIPVGFAEAVTVGVGLTVIATVLVPVQLPFAPVTV
jgi:hypothetical protein